MDEESTGMKSHWAALGVGVAIGAVLAYWMGSKAMGAVAPIGNKTRFNFAK